MKKMLTYLKENKKILVIAVLLIALLALAFVLYGSKNKMTSAVNQTVTERSATETKLMRILSEIDGVGQAEVLINEGENGVEGVIIVCEGANSLMTRNDVINAVVTALKVNKNNIAIYAMNK